MFDSQQIWGAETWPEGPWGHITIAPGEESCLLGIDGGVVEVDLATGRILRTMPSPAPSRPPLFAVSADGEITVVRAGEGIEVMRAGEEPPLVLPLGSTVWPSPDGSLLLVRAPWDTVRNRDGAATLFRWSDRTSIRSSDAGGGVSVVAWLGARVAFADRHDVLHLWDADGRAALASIPGRATGLVPLVFEGKSLLLTAMTNGRGGRTELRSPIDGSLVRVLSDTRSITGAVTTDGRIVTVQGLVVSLATGATLREPAHPMPIGRILIAPRGDRAVFAHESRLLLFDLSRWEVIRHLDDVCLTPGYPFGGEYLPDGRLVIVESGGRVALLDAEGEVQWSFTLTRDPAWEGKWELPAWSTASVRCTGDAIVVGVGWIQRGPVQGDGHQDYEDRGREVVLGLDGTLLDRVPPELPAPPERMATIEKRSDRHEVVVVRHGGKVVELDVTLAHGKPSSVAMSRDASWLLIGTKRGLLLGYR